MVVADHILILKVEAKFTTAAVKELVGNKERSSKGVRGAGARALVDGRLGTNGSKESGVGQVVGLAAVEETLVLVGADPGTGGRIVRGEETSVASATGESRAADQRGCRARGRRRAGAGAGVEGASGADTREDSGVRAQHSGIETVGTSVELALGNILTEVGVA